MYALTLDLLLNYKRFPLKSATLHTLHIFHTTPKILKTLKPYFICQ